MPDSRITDLSGLITITNNNSVFTIVDLDEASPDDQNKKITFSDLLTNIDGGLTLSAGTVKITVADTTPDFLFNKLVAGTNMSFTVNNPGGVETLTLDATTGGGEDYFAANSAGALPGASGTDSFAIGTNAQATANSAYQIGPGTNATVNTLQYLTNNIADVNGLTTSFTAPVNYTPVTNNNISSHLQAVDTALGTVNTDQQVRISANDTTADFLLNKVTAGTLISVTEINDGADEDLQIAFTGVGTDELAKVTANDTTSDYLLNKITAGTLISITEINDGADEDLQIAFTGVGTDELIRITANDTTSDYLLNKIVSGSSGDISLTELNDAADEDLEIEFIGFPQIVAESTGTINANNKELIPVNVSGGVATVNPPGSPSAGFRFAISDSRGNSSVNNITVDFITATDNLHGASQNDVVNVNEDYREYLYVNGTIGWIKK